MNQSRTRTRRRFNQSVSLAKLGAMAPMGCSSDAPSPSYHELIANPWRHTDGRIEQGPALRRELVRYAARAARYPQIETAGATASGR